MVGARLSAMLAVWRHEATARGRRNSCEGRNNRRKQDTALFAHLGNSGLWRGTAAPNTQDTVTQSLTAQNRHELASTCALNYASVDMNKLKDKPSWTLRLATALSDVTWTQFTTPPFLPSKKPATKIKYTNYRPKYPFFGRYVVAFFDNVAKRATVAVIFTERTKLKFQNKKIWGTRVINSLLRLSKAHLYQKKYSKTNVTSTCTSDITNYKKTAISISFRKGQVVPITATKACREVKKLHSSCVTSALDGDEKSHHAPDALFPGKNASTHRTGWRVDPNAPVRAIAKEEKPLVLQT